MDKEEIKKHCDAIEEILVACLELEDLEDVREHLRVLKGEKQPARVRLTETEVDIIEATDSDDKLENCYLLTKDGWEFIATEENVRLFRTTIIRGLDELIAKIIHTGMEV